MRISDWSSDVCSSDLMSVPGPGLQPRAQQRDVRVGRRNAVRRLGGHGQIAGRAGARARSEERRVGKEGVRTCWSWWCPIHLQPQTHLLSFYISQLLPLVNKSYIFN